MVDEIKINNNKSSQKTGKKLSTPAEDNFVKKLEVLKATKANIAALRGTQVSAFGDDIVCRSDAFSLEKVEVFEQIPQSVIDAVKCPTTIKQKYTINSEFCPSKEIEVDEELFCKAFNNILPEGSVLKDKGALFLKSARECVFEEKTDESGQKCKYYVYSKDKKPIDPFLMVGISFFESGRGTSKMANDYRNNIAGLNVKRFKSDESSINYLGAYINKRVKENGLDTVTMLSQSGKYCDPSVADHWAKNVKGIAEELKNEYNRLIKEKENEIMP